MHFWFCFELAFCYRLTILLSPLTTLYVVIAPTQLYLIIAFPQIYFVIAFNLTLPLGHFVIDLTTNHYPFP